MARRSWFRHPAILALVIAPAVAGCAVAAASGSAHDPARSHLTASHGGISPQAARRLDNLAIKIARSDRYGRPSYIAAVATTQQKALTIATPGDLIPGSAQRLVYLVVMRGHFADDRAGGPAGSTTPTGTYIGFDVSRSTFAVLDFGLQPKAPATPLSSLGPVTVLTR
jgi:hypothetical protein